MTDVLNETARQRVHSICGAIDHIAATRNLPDEFVKIIGVLAGFELAARRMGPVAAIEYVRSIADILEQEALSDAGIVATCN